MLDVLQPPKILLSEYCSVFICPWLRPLFMFAPGFGRGISYISQPGLETKEFDFSYSLF
jgi:hypothetical protein